MLNENEKNQFKNYVARYNNDLHKEIQINKLNETEFNFLIAILSNITKNIRNDTSVFYIETFKKMLNIEWNITTQEIKEQFNRLFNKLNGAKIVKKDNDNFFSCNMFQNYGYRKNEQNKTEFYYKLTDMFNYIFSNIKKRFTQIYLQEFIKIKGIYAKRLYEYLSKYNNEINSQYRTISEWREILNIRESTPNRNLMNQIFNPTIKELNKTETFKDLKINLNKQNRTITAIGFIWTKQKDLNKVLNNFMNISDYEQKLKTELINKLDNHDITANQYIKESVNINKKIDYLKNNPSKEIKETPKPTEQTENLKFYGIVKQYGNKKEGFINTKKEIIQAPNREKAKEIYNNLHQEYKNYRFQVTSEIDKKDITDILLKYKFKIHYFKE